MQVMSTSFPEVAANTGPGDTLFLAYDQRIAMENDYDYGYTDVSTDGGDAWTTVFLIDNPGFSGTPGISQDWDSVDPVGPGHISIDLSDYAGQEIAIRFRFESDMAYSSQDQFDNLPFHSVQDGAWQLDNIALYDSDPYEGSPFWLDDCESPGDNGWVHDDIPATGQAGVAFWRGLYGTDIWTNRPFTCSEGSGWMYAAVDPLTIRMVDDENSWLATEYLDDAVGEVEVDSVPGLRDFAGGFDFMTHDDQECVLRGGCPELALFDVIQPRPGVAGAELVAEYVKADMTMLPAGVAYTDSTGYQTVTLGFGIEFMSDLQLPNGQFASGSSDRVNLMANIMGYFGKTPTGPPTGVDESVFVTRLSQARPNPFNSLTTIEYSVAAESRVAIRVYDAAGLIVRTLVDASAGPGEHRAIWDGTTDTGQRAASGVYFIRMEASGEHTSYREARKLVLLK
ncbi:MAG: FlgD immunoglobulin-like domain containing protein [Candidatus Eisenbacteria bacterium]